MQGCVVWFNKVKGYGFIKNLETNENVFVHYSAICPHTKCHKTLFEGEYVEFETAEIRNKIQVTRVTGICNGKLRCDFE